ncbi:nicotinamide-nucleotide adenylyltransferase [Methanolobus psychrotolerans]|uniref:nicotinamide-nucleotide adenylyltransferase n=1 Tax=Methanolobus psychrotolerans TaxID=1874706 RepID=UPI000B915631|nr:nicotinamide-nucleotide adenylyltransferase [Methanolobus psychrotolerans]
MYMRRAFYIGRFQPFHLGHYSIINDIARDVDEVVIGIGSAQKSHEPMNPFTAGERVMMIKHALETADVKHYAIPIEDLQRNAVWVSHIISMTPPFDVVYSNNPLVVRLFKEAGITVRQPPMYKREGYSGSETRRRMLNDEDWRSLVPQAVADVLDEIDGVNRLKSVSKSDID